jgi:hypothetical protein
MRQDKTAIIKLNQLLEAASALGYSIAESPHLDNLLPKQRREYANRRREFLAWIELEDDNTDEVNL